jgi:hypothetical protein
MEEKKHKLAKFAPLLITGGIVLFALAFYARIMTIGLQIDGTIAGLVGALAMSVAMMIV